MKYPQRSRSVNLQVNGRSFTRTVDVWTSLADFLRAELGLTGTHVGCEHGVCGSCTILLDGEPVRSCLLFAVQAGGRSIQTVEGLATDTTQLHPLQTAFQLKHGLQCGYCTPGILMAALAFLQDVPTPTDEQIREMLAGHLCRCTGYQFIVDAIHLAATMLHVDEPERCDTLQSA
jgi:carbon-monoxide dehydrogenase small subunit